MTSPRPFLTAFSTAIGHQPDEVLTDPEPGDHLPSVYAVTDFAVDAIANAAGAARRLRRAQGGRSEASGPISVNRRLAGLWFGSSIHPVGWKPGSVWDEIAGIYPTTDGYVRLHTNAPHHRRAAIDTLGCGDDRDSVGAALARCSAIDVQESIYERGGVAVALNSRQQWRSHPQGRAVRSEPLVHREDHRPTVAPPTSPAERSLAGVRVLDLTRVLAGPVATRFLAGLGADVLRIDPPDWHEPAVVPDVTLGKRCARLDLTDDADRSRFVDLLAGADILVHGYRPGALDNLGFGPTTRRRLSPGLVDVSLNAWGHQGPWSGRRGFDSIVQAACGIALAGQIGFADDQPKPLPVQALDHATGYTLAAAAIEGWTQRHATGAGSSWRTSLAAHAELLCAGPPGPGPVRFPPPAEHDLAGSLERTDWGPARRVRFPIGKLMRWDSGAVDLGTTVDPSWPARR